MQLVLTGHEHKYQHSKPIRGGIPAPAGTPGTVYMVSGGGGGVLHPVSPQPFLDQQGSIWHYLRVSVDGPKLTIQTIEVDDDIHGGEEFDRLVISLPPVSQPQPDRQRGRFLPTLASGGLSASSDNGSPRHIPGFQAPLPDSRRQRVTVNSTPLALTYASPSQINAALPLDFLGQAMLRVTTQGGFAETPISVADSAPAIFTAAITHADGSLVSSDAPVTPGETLIIYMTGLGAVNGKLAAGQAAPSSPLLSVLAPVVVQIGDTTQVTPDFAGLTPGFVGVYQVNVKVPLNLPPKIYPLRVTVKGTVSNSQNIQVQARNP